MSAATSHSSRPVAQDEVVHRGFAATDIVSFMTSTEDLAGLAADLREAAGLLIRRMRHESGTTLTWSQSILLSGLARHGHATASELAAENGLRTQTVWSSLATLEGRGLVTRQRDSADRRNVYLSLTDNGRSELAIDRRVRENWIVGVLSQEFTAAQRSILAQAAPMLARLASFGQPDETGRW